MRPLKPRSLSGARSFACVESVLFRLSRAKRDRVDSATPVTARVAGTTPALVTLTATLKLYSTGATLSMTTVISASVVTIAIAIEIADITLPVNIGAAVLNGVLAAPLMAVIMHMASSSKVMDKFTVPLYLRVVGWTATAVMLAVSIGVFATWK